MALTGYSVLTPRRSPRLLAKRCSQRPQHTIDASVRDKLRKFVEQTEETEIELLDGLERYLVSQEATIFSSLSFEPVKADVGNNILKRFLLITRKLKSFDDQLGPYDAVKLVVNEDGCYKLICHGRCMEENVVSPPFNASCILLTLGKLALF